MKTHCRLGHTQKCNLERPLLMAHKYSSCASGSTPRGLTVTGLRRGGTRPAAVVYPRGTPGNGEDAVEL